MEDPKLYIPKKKYTGESAVVSMRMPKDMLRDVDRIAAETGRTRNELLSIFIEFAIEHLDNGGKDNG
ncbi:MAG: hypothetical protein IJP43_02135 [Oscillospiraceae bacterium]|nr:hypothetical protein [Oscillospiraceae bacterium]